jgi:protease-4
MKQFLITVAGVLVGLTVFALAAPMIGLALLSAAVRPAPLPGRAVLDLDLRAGLTDQGPRGPLAVLGARQASVTGIEMALRRAEADDAVKGLFVRLPEGGMAPGAADELRLAFKDFRAHGKPILAYGQGLYADPLVLPTYELAAASGDIWMQPGSAFQATGIARQDLFFKRAFDRYGVVADYQQRYEYKNAVDPFLHDDYTPAHREAELSWMGSVYDTVAASVAADRRSTAAAVKALLEAGPYAAETARAKGLIDRVGQVQEARDAIVAMAGPGASLVDFSDYAQRARTPRAAPFSAGPKIALISAEGAIMTGRGGEPNPLGGEPAIGSDQVAGAFHDAVADSDVRAIVFRLDSPGGSDTASEQILAGIRAARAAGKPVVVSLGTYGASGGYWVASGANEIVAEPATLTGSIGVFGGKFALGPALARLGVDVRGLSVGGGYADAFGPGAPMTAAQRAAFSAWMDQIYNAFVARVAEGRHLKVDQVRAIARGRVWTGAQARELGLVDELGGLYTAVDRAKALAGVRGEVRLEPFGRAGNFLEQLQRMLGVEARGARLAQAGADIADDPRLGALLAALRDARLRAAGATVLAPRLLR